MPKLQKHQGIDSPLPCLLEASAGQPRPIRTGARPEPRPLAPNVASEQLHTSPAGVGRPEQGPLTSLGEPPLPAGSAHELTPGSSLTRLAPSTLFPLTNSRRHQGVKKKPPCTPTFFLALQIQPSSTTPNWTGPSWQAELLPSSGADCLGPPAAWSRDDREQHDLRLACLCPYQMAALTGGHCV